MCPTEKMKDNYGKIRKLFGGVHTFFSMKIKNLSYILLLWVDCVANLREMVFHSCHKCVKGLA